MSEVNSVLKAGFFKFLVSIEMLKEKKDKYLFISSIGISEDDLNEYLFTLYNFQIEVKIDQDYIYPLSKVPEFHLDMSLSEWFSMQILIHTEKDKTDYAYKVLKNKIEELNKTHEKFNLFKKLNKAQLKIGVDKISERLDYFIVHRKVVKLFFDNQNECEILPMRLAFLDGVLCIIGENIPDKTLCYFALADIYKMEDVELHYEAHISQIEVNEFIGHIRMINGNEERLILKIYSTNEVDLLPKFHYLGNPFVTSNSEGNMIWAANIEVCEDVYNWLFTMKDFVEVLDPGHIRKEFAHFCEMKKENNSKKAS